MKALGSSFSKKIILVPAVLAITFFLVFLGMRAPNVPKTSASKAQIRAVVETQTKAAQTGIEKSGQTVDVCSRTAMVEPSSTGVSACRHEVGISPTSVVLTIPSRASPAFRG